MSYELLTLKTNQLNNSIITKICELKNTHWKHNLDNQKKFFYNNSKKLDHHNLLYSKSKLVGYTMLRRRKLYKKKKYLLFDTLIIHKDFRNKGLAKKIMEFNNLTIKKLNLISILYCEKNLIKFYKNNSWELQKFKNRKLNKFVMTFNYDKFFNIRLNRSIIENADL